MTVDVKRCDCSADRPLHALRHKPLTVVAPILSRCRFLKRSNTYCACIIFQRFLHSTSGLNAYDVIQKKESDGERTLYRDHGMQEKKMNQNEWFKRGGYQSVLFLPHTRNSILCKKAKDIIRKTDLKIRVVERAGVSLRNTWKNSTVGWPAPRCGSPRFANMMGSFRTSR